MKRTIMVLIFIFFLAPICHADDVGLSFFIQPSDSGDKAEIAFGVAFDFLWITKTISIGADWGVFETTKNSLIGWSFRFHFKKLTVPIGYDFVNKKFYVGLGATF